VHRSARSGHFADESGLRVGERHNHAAAGGAGNSPERVCRAKAKADIARVASECGELRLVVLANRPAFSNDQWAIE
jgi:hypothetical protein